MSGFDLDSFNLDELSEEGAEMQLYHPAIPGKLLDVFITLMGPDSETARLAQREFTTRSLRPRNSKEKKTPKQELEEADHAISVAFAKVTKGWRGVRLNNQEVPFSFDAAVDLYMNHRWVREQVERFHNDRANFFDSSKVNSEPQ